MIKLIIFLTALIVVGGMPPLAYSKFGVFAFAGGSDSTLRVVRLSSGAIASLSIALLSYLVFFIWYSKIGILEIITLLTLITLWVIGSRVVGVFPDGRIVAGWYLFPTHIIDLREHNIDPEVYITNTQILARSSYFFEVQSGHYRAKMFVGPFLQDKLSRKLKEIGFEVVEADQASQ